MAELSRWCGRCGTGLRAGARFCSTCGQRVIDEAPAARRIWTRTWTWTRPGPGPEERVGPGFTEVGLPGVVPFPGPDSPPRNEWSDWYASTEPSSPLRAPGQRPHPTASRAASGTTQRNRLPAAADALPGPAAVPTAVRASSAGPPALGTARPAGARRSRAPLFWSVLSAAVAVAVVVTVLLLHPFNHHDTVNDAANDRGGRGLGHPERADLSNVSVRLGVAIRDRRGVGVRVRLIDGGHRAAGRLERGRDAGQQRHRPHGDQRRVQRRLRLRAEPARRRGGLHPRRQLPARAAGQPGDHAGPVGAAARAADRPHQGLAGVGGGRPGPRDVGQR